MINKQQKKELVTKFGRSSSDTGSTEVQIAILTSRINDLKGHFSDHKHDYQSIRGLLKMVEARRSLLRYLSNKDRLSYQNVLKELKLRA